MKRKLPVLIAIILVLAIALSACNYKLVRVDDGTENDPLPAHVENQIHTPEETKPEIAQTQPLEIIEPQYITLDEAIANALKDAALQEADVTGLHAELERDDGITIYDVDFYKDGKEYDYEINAETGKVINAEKDRNDHD